MTQWLRKPAVIMGATSLLNLTVVSFYLGQRPSSPIPLQFLINNESPQSFYVRLWAVLSALTTVVMLFLICFYRLKIAQLITLIAAVFLMFMQAAPIMSWFLFLITDPHLLMLPVLLLHCVILAAGFLLLAATLIDIAKRSRRR